MIVSLKVDGTLEMFDAENTSFATIEMEMGMAVLVNLFIRNVFRKVSSDMKYHMILNALFSVLHVYGIS